MMKAFVTVLTLVKHPNPIQVPIDVRRAATADEALGASVVEAMAKLPGHALTSQSCTEITEFAVKFARERGEE